MVNILSLQLSFKTIDRQKQLEKVLLYNTTQKQNKKQGVFTINSKRRLRSVKKSKMELFHSEKANFNQIIPMSFEIVMSIC